MVNPAQPAPPVTQMPPAPQPSSNNQHPPHIKKAHSFLFIYVFLLLAALLAGGIYAWQNSKVKNLNSKLSAANATNSGLKKQLTQAEASIPTNTNAGNAPNNPYAGEKTFCDNFSSTCLRYPKDWVIAGTTSSSKTSETFTNATSSTVVSYDNPYGADKTEQVYFIADIQDLTIKSLGPKIVGRVLGSAPDYSLVDASYVSSVRAQIGQSISFVSNPVFTTNVQNATARLKAAPTAAAAANIKSSDQATAWFKTDDAKTALKILQSLYYQ